jgi:hypothetical protein
VSARLMYRAIRALLAMLMLAALACTFDHSGLLPGSPPSSDDATSGGAGIGGQGGAGGSFGNAGGEGPDASYDDANDPDGGAGGGPELDAPAALSDATPDSANPQADDGSPDVASPDAEGDEAPVADAGRDCSTKPNGKAFTSPGESMGHCYWFHSIPSNWVGAANTCTSEGGHLATIASNEENAFVLGLLSTSPADEKVWIGGTDGRFSSDGPGSGPYLWITGQPMSYVNWYSDTSTTEPDGACKLCGANPCFCEHRVAIGRDGRWADEYEANPNRFVCESD